MAAQSAVLGQPSLSVDRERGSIRLMHIMPSFDPGGAQVRISQIMNYLGPQCSHAIFAFDGRFGASHRVSPEIPVVYDRILSEGSPLRTVLRLMTLIRKERPNLILTYNWGAIEAAVAAVVARVAPLIHAEDGFGDDEAQGQKTRRILARRFVLRHAQAVVSPAESLASRMRNEWKLSDRLVRYIPNGVDVKHFTPGLTQISSKPRECIVGTVGGLRKEKRQDLLIKVCAALHPTVPIRLVIAGEGPERGALLELAGSLGFGERVSLLGHAADIRTVLHQLDVFALSSSTEQMPLSVLEAMACGLPVISTAVGDVKSMVSSLNRPYVSSDLEEYKVNLSRLCLDSNLRHEIGSENRTRVVERFSISAMLSEYRQLYESMIGNLTPAPTDIRC